MSRSFAVPLPSPKSMPSSPEKHQIDLNLDGCVLGVAANVKLLLKLIQDHSDACNKDAVDHSRRSQIVTTMITIIDDIRSRIDVVPYRPVPELRRCNTDLRRRPNPSQPPSLEDHYRLRKELTASVAARKSLEKMFSSLGKEKEFIAAELARKVQETQGLEEHVSDLKAQNEMLLEKVTAFKGGGGGASAAVAALEERNRALSEQLLKALERYRGLKRRVKEVKEENVRARETFEAIEREAAEGIDCIGGVRWLVLVEGDGRRGGTRKVEAAVAAVERTLRGIRARVGREDGLPVAA